MDSTPEGTGFEPSVPRGKGPTLRVSVLFRSDFSVGGEPTRGDIERLVVSRGTDGSNPVPSTGESGANLIFGDEPHRGALISRRRDPGRARGGPCRRNSLLRRKPAPSCRRPPRRCS